MRRPSQRQRLRAEDLPGLLYRVALLTLFVSLACSSSTDGSAPERRDAGPDTQAAVEAGVGPDEGGQLSDASVVGEATEAGPGSSQADAASAITPSDCDAAASFAITIEPGVGGTVTLEPDGDRYACGTMVRITATPDSGMEFVEWTNGLTGSENPTTLVVTEDLTIAATFRTQASPEIVNVDVMVAGNSATIVWQTEPQTSGALQYWPQGEELVRVALSEQLATEHAAQLRDLEFDTTYGYRVLAVDASGNESDPLEGTFQTGPFMPGLPLSDDFSNRQLTPTWQVFDPIGDGAVALAGHGTADAWLELSVPEGTAHDPWVGGNNSLRVMQPVADDDFQVEVKFESMPSARNQNQGLLVEQSAGTFLRFDVYSTGSAVNLFAATIDGGDVEEWVDIPIAEAAAIFLRLQRSGDQWNATYSSDGQDWVEAASFSDELGASAVGVFAGNAGENPAFTASVDYFFETDSPILPEDPTCDPGDEFELSLAAVGPGAISVEPELAAYLCGQEVTLTALPDAGAEFLGWSGEVDSDVSPLNLTISAETALAATFEGDVIPPAVFGVSVTTGETTATVNWETSELSTGAVQYGPTTAYDSMVEVDADTSHEVILTGLTPATTYYYRIVAQDAAGNETTTEGGTFVAGVAPTIDVWYGDSQTFGQPGLSQRWVNILGNASSPHGIASLSFSLNGGDDEALNWLPFRRLAEEGDFNVEIDPSRLLSGANSVVIRAEDTVGALSFQEVTVQFSPNTTWPLDFLADWSNVADVTDVAQIVDGLWSIDSGQLRNGRMRYDRTVAIGDQAWTDYEVTVPVTVHGINDDGFGGLNLRPALGVMLRWPGHGPVNGAQPGHEYRPQGGGAWYDIRPDLEGRLYLQDFEDLLEFEDLTIPFDTPYLFKVRVETVSENSARYFTKVWPQASPEPADWNLTGVDISDVSSGSLLLVAHFVDVSFGDVLVTRLDTENFVRATDGIADAGEETIRVETTTGTYFLDKEGGGLTSMVDLDGNDWIGFSDASGFSGEYRGFPNLGACCHPGYPEAADDPLSKVSMLTSIDEDASSETQVRVISRSADDLWRNIWDFFPSHATLTIEAAEDVYYVQYEGTPGGSFDLTDFWTTSDGAIQSMAVEWTEDLPDPEWVYFSDGAINRSLMLIHHEGDAIGDRYWNGSGSMTVFGFGRIARGPSRGLSATPRQISLGFVESRSHAALSSAVGLVELP